MGGVRCHGAGSLAYPRAMHIHRLFAVAVLLISAGSVEGCKKKVVAGSKCTGESSTPNSFTGSCQGKGAALACIGGTIKELKCVDKPVGCMEVMGKVSCDQIIDIGEPCGGKEYTCSTDNKKMLQCKDGEWKLKMACKSSKGCNENAEGVNCVSAEAEEGDDCNQKDAGSCSPDKSKLLVCDGKKFFVASTCRGQNKCRSLGSKIECDTSKAEVADHCEDKDKLACDTAMNVMLVCDGKKFVEKQKCKKRCNNAFDKYSCD